MKLPFQVLPAGPVVLVGSDIPALRAGHIARAFRLLGQHDLVFGPASDGGFWLVGARRLKPLPRTLFAAVRWSTAQALADTLAGLPAAISTGFADTLAGLPAGISTGLADTLDDVDDAQDLRRLQIRSAGRSA
jgi:glycosyltransferase A (GT-A) superfamily protein (DUF2064 family)